MSKLITSFIAFAILISSSFADTLLVPSQYPTIQAGIDASSDGDTVLVSPGTYVENINFEGNEIVVKSASGPEVTIIDGNQAGRVVTFNSGEGVNSILEGFTVTNGVVENGSGGGIRCTNSSDPTITNNIITRNSSSGFSSVGGGIASYDYSDPTITNNIITMNTAYDGGGIGFKYCFATITNNIITGNSASHGGGIYGYYAGAHVINNVITDNTSSSWGGGMAVLEATHYSPNPIWEICNNIIADNDGNSDGGGLSIQCSWPNGHNITNNTITGNTADDGGAIALWLTANPVITNSILWGNTPPEIYISSGGGTPTVNYSNIMGGWSGVGNIDEDPLFVNASSGDYHLQSTIGSYHGGAWLPDPLQSLCIDAGDPRSPFSNEPLPNGDCINMGAYGNTEEASLSMITSVALYEEEFPKEFALQGNYPNPFNPTTTIRFDLPKASHVRLEVFNIHGQSVGAHCDEPMIDGWWNAGYHEVTFDGSGLASGIYFYRIEAGDFSASSKMVLLK